MFVIECKCHQRYYLVVCQLLQIKLMDLQIRHICYIRYTILIFFNFFDWSQCFWSILCSPMVGFKYSFILYIIIAKQSQVTVSYNGIDNFSPNQIAALLTIIWYALHPDSLLFQVSNHYQYHHQDFWKADVGSYRIRIG